MAIAPSAARAAWGFETLPPPSGGLVDPPANATAIATYTFEAPGFTTGQTTPILNHAPNSGAVGVVASFTSSPTVNGFFVQNFQPNPLTVGNVLYDPENPADILTVALNVPVQSLTFKFATIVPGRLDLTSTSGNASVTSGNVGGSFPGGTFSFSPGIDFTSFTLAAFDTSNVPTLFALDNLDLTVTVIPEPAAAMSLLAGACACALRRRRVRG